ncbi:MAG: response regulator [Cyanobacteria bacterium J06627_28]
MKQQVLVIENEEIIRDVYLDCLATKGFAAMGACGGRQGLQLAQQHLPSLIVCDVAMPDIDGYDLLFSLRQDPTTAVIPVFFFRRCVVQKTFAKVCDWVPMTTSLSPLR